MIKKFTPGSTVYSIDGQVANYISPAASGGHIIEAIYDADDDEPHYGGPEVWREVFATPPREKLAGDLAELRDEITAAHAKLSSITEERRALESSVASLRVHATKNPELAPLAMWLNDEVKFAVVLGGDYGGQFNPALAVVGPAPEVFRRKDDRHSRKIRLVSLYWEPEDERRYSIRIARYEDGTGGKASRVFLGQTQQEALDAAAAHVSYQQKVAHNEHVYAEIGVWLAHFGYDSLIDPRTRKLMNEANAKARSNIAAQAKAELDRAEAAVVTARVKFERTQADLAAAEKA